MNEDNASLERALERTEGDIAGAARQAAAVARELKKAQKAAATGTVRELERALAAAEELTATLRESARVARAGWRFDVEDHMQSGAYTAELLAAARAADLPLQEQDERLLAFPSLVRVAAADAALEIDRKRERAIRPSAVVARLRAASSRPVRFRPAQFLEALHAAYRLALAEDRRSDRGGTVKVLDVYRVLTVMPGSAAAYPKAEFARDLYLLEESGERRTRDGAELYFAAAAGTRGTQKLTTVSRDGRALTYYAIGFGS